MAAIRLPAYVDTLESDAPIYSMTAAEQIVSRMKKGDEFAYYRGNLLGDRWIPLNLGNGERRDRKVALNMLANLMAGYATKSGALVQRKLGLLDYMYLYQR